MAGAVMISVRKQPIIATAALVAIMVTVYIAIDLAQLQLGELKPLIVLGIPIVGLMAAYALEAQHEEKQFRGEV